MVGNCLNINVFTSQDGEPCAVGIAITDLSTGLFAKGAILAALYQREKTGLGQKIDCNLLSTQVSNLSNFCYLSCLLFMFFFVVLTVKVLYQN